MNFTSRAWAGGLLTAAIAIFAVVVVSAQKDQPKDPPPFHFVVDIGGQTTHFRSVSGLKIETEVVEYQEGGDNSGTIRKLPGATRYTNIRLSRAFTGDRFLYDWFAATQQPGPTRIDGLLSLVDRHGTRVASWKFVNGFPVKWELSELDAAKNEVAIETIEIAHEGLTRTPEGGGQN